MRSPRAESGFAVTELLVASLVTMAVMALAFSTFSDGMKLNDATIKLTDASQNLRAGTNLLIRDLLQTGRNIPTGGISIPHGLNSQPISRPSPPATSLRFDNTTAETLSSLTTGNALGPAVSGRTTDILTIVMDDPYLEPLSVAPATATGTVPKLGLDGSYFSIGSQGAWMVGDPANGIAPVRPGDLMYFLTAAGSAIQTVTRVDASNVYFDAGDPFNFNQRNAEAGSITQIRGTTMTVRRVIMITYYVQETVPGQPRLMRGINFGTAQALAGVVEDLQFQYDLADGIYNPANVDSVPYTANGVTYTSSQIRKVTLNVGVRSETKSTSTKDYLRHHIQTVASLRNLAYVDRYQ
jgi:hypothetical protein